MPLVVRNFTRHSQKNLSQIVFMSYVSLSLTYLCTREKWRNQRNKTVARSGSPTIEPSLDLKLCWCCSGVEWVVGLVALWVNGRDFQGECFIGGILDNQWVRCFSDDKRWVFFFFFCFNEGYNLLCCKVDYGNGVVENTMADFCFWFG